MLGGYQMKKKNKILGVFTAVILMLFAYGVIHSGIYDRIIAESRAIELSKESFVDIAFPKYDINNRALVHGEEKLRHYKVQFSGDVLKKQLIESAYGKDKFYIMIEKPDAQYLEVTLNDRVIDSFGDLSGRANLWNGIYFVKIDNEAIMKNNKLIITLYSDYMTGVAGRIFLVPKSDFRTLEIFASFTNSLVNSAIVISAFACVILLMIIMAWRNQLYNLKAYTFFMLAILFLGISLMDFSKHSYLWISYINFKKMIVLSYHFAITLVGLGIAYMVNAKYKGNIGMIGLGIMLLQSILINDMIAFREAYAIVNYIIVLTTLQIIAILFYYRRRAKLGASVLLIGFILTAIAVLRLVFITSSIASSSMLIDLPILIVNFVTVVLFLLYQEMVQVVSDNDNFEVEDRYEIGLTNYMQGAFTIDKSLTVVGAYSSTCDRIFNRHIVGENILNLLEDDRTDREFLKDILTMFFDPAYSFKDGFMALLPEKLEVGERIYQLNYSVVDCSEIRLRITLSDITRSIELNAQLELEKKNYEFVINALKSRQELGYFIERTSIFFERIAKHGFTPYHVAELHTLKGNLGQFGFTYFEKSVHQVESALLGDDVDENMLLDQLKEGFNKSLYFLENYVNLSFFDQGYGQLTLKREEILSLETAYREVLEDRSKEEAFEKRIRELSYIDLKGMFQRYQDYIARMSHDTEKSILPFEATGDRIKVSPEKAENLLRVLVAVFRNAVVHGIEKPEVRTEMGKDSFGHIACHIELLGDDVKIVINDDGKGINLDFVEKKAIQYGLTTIERLKGQSRAERLNIIFESGMSQLEDVDILAGRGVGLYLVREVVNSMHGSILVTSDLGKGTLFELIIPVTYLRES
jgi:two-component system chemotaxis sensor kinase CheA